MRGELMLVWTNQRAGECHPWSRYTGGRAAHPSSHQVQLVWVPGPGTSSCDHCTVGNKGDRLFQPCSGIFIRAKKTILTIPWLFKASEGCPSVLLGI